MFSPFERLMAFRYMRPRRKEGVVGGVRAQHVRNVCSEEGIAQKAGEAHGDARGGAIGVWLRRRGHGATSMPHAVACATTSAPPPTALCCP